MSGISTSNSQYFHTADRGFSCFLYAAFFAGIMIREKKADKILFFSLGVIMASIIIFDNKLLGFVIKGSKETVKGFAQINGFYSDSSDYYSSIAVKRGLGPDG